LRTIQQALAAAIELIEGEISFGDCHRLSSGKFGHRLSVVQTFERRKMDIFSTTIEIS
jgi:hypothetical protein